MLFQRQNCLLLISISLVFSCPVDAQIQFGIEDLGFAYEVSNGSPIGGIYESRAHAINDDSMVVGESRRINGGTVTTYWIDGAASSVYINAGAQSFLPAYAVNEFNALAGGSISTNHSAFYWDGSYTFLGTLPGGTRSRAYGINDNDVVVGGSKSSAAEERPFIWQNGTMSELQMPPNFPTDGRARDINNAGQVVGRGYSFQHACTCQYEGLLWENGVAQILPDLVGDGNTGATEGMAINEAGQIVGYSGLSAAVWENNTVQQLPPLPASSIEIAYDNNEAGDAVGSALVSGLGGGVPVAVLWSKGVVYDLNDQLDSSGDNWLLQEARGINNLGQIVGWGINPDGETRAFLLTPVEKIILGDVNLDGVVNLLDIDPFILRVSTLTYQAEADVNSDGEVNLLDVAPFIAILGDN